MRVYDLTAVAVYVDVVEWNVIAARDASGRDLLSFNAHRAH
jgi:hypothetical protein